MPIDNFQSFQRGLTAPAADAFAIVKSDTTDFAYTARAIYVGGSGDVALMTLTGNAVTFKALSAGTVLPVSAVRVNNTGTTATNLVALL